MLNLLVKIRTNDITQEPETTSNDKLLALKRKQIRRVVFTHRPRHRTE